MPSKDPDTLVFQPHGQRTPVKPGLSILEHAGNCGVELESTCGGKGVCGRCKVKVEGGASPPGETESKTLGPDLEKGYRLACRAEPLGSSVIWVPEQSRKQKQVILTTGDKLEFSLDPALTALGLQVPDPVLGGAAAHRERCLAEIEKKIGKPGASGWKTPIAVLAELPDVLKEGQGNIGALVRLPDEVADISPKTALDCLGLAVDLGTTTMVAYLFDLISGELLSVNADMNPQVTHGDDVISRITICQKGPAGLEMMSNLARGAIERLARLACREAGKEIDRIFECVVVGNTAMHHIFLGLDPSGLAMAPYAPVAGDALANKASDLGFGAFHPRAIVHTLPVKAGFVGADTVAAALSLDADKVEEPTLIVDLGTNGEMVLATADRILCCSTAAGPAFEGGHIRCGMRGAPGAIDKVRLAGPGADPELRVIGDRKPTGICGSGLVSLVSQLVAAGLVNPGGGYDADCSSARLRKGPSGMEYLLADSAGTSTGNDLVLTHADLAELQLAKAAIHAGVSIMMAELGLERVEKVQLAGAFGNYLDTADACGINMLPNVEPHMVRGVGNAAGAGAIMALLSRKERQRARLLASKMEYLELAAHPLFNDSYSDGMFF